MILICDKDVVPQSIAILEANHYSVMMSSAFRYCCL